MGQQSVLIICGKVFDGIHEELTGPAEIMVEGNRITRMGKHLSRPADVRIVDCSDATVTPGMIDNHIHCDHFDWQTRSRDLHATSDEWKVLAALHCAQRTLERGFTTVRALNFGITGFGLVDVKKAINAGYFAGSRLFVAAHRLGASGGHSDTSQYMSGNPAVAEGLKQPGIGAGVDFFRNAVRDEIKYGSDIVKFTLSGGFSSPSSTPEEQQLPDEELKAMLEVANNLNKPSTCHVYSPRLIAKLVEFGISCIEHGSLMDEPTARLMEERGTCLVPTFNAYDAGININEADLAKLPEAYRNKVRVYSPMLRESRKIILKSKIKLGFGSDIVALHQNYESWREYASWLNSGADPFRALRAATSVNAEILRQPDLGVLAVGKLADIAAWKRDLLNDPEALSECAFVMKDGIVYSTV